MRWVTRAGARMDRASMVWAIRRRVDPAAEFAFLPDGEVLAYAEANGATPFHHPGAELRHTGLRTGFDAVCAKYGLLNDPAMTALAMILRGAETQERTLTQWSHGVRAVASGIRATQTDDQAFVDAMGPVLDGLYRFCQELIATELLPPKGGA